METDRLLPNKEYRFSAALFARVVGCVGSIAEGYDIGCLGAIVADVRKDLSLSPQDVGLLASLPHCCFALAALGGGLLADFVGRKGAILATCLCLLVGTCVQVLAPGLWCLIAGRAIVNAAAGSGVVVVSTYLTEVTPAKHRGLFVSVEELCFNFGFLSAYLANWALIGTPNAWRIVIGLGAVPPAVAAVLCILPQVPESPLYLLLRGRYGEARVMLRRLLREPEEVAEVVAAWEEADGDASPIAAMRRAPQGAVVASVGLAICTSLAGVLAVNPLLSYVLVAAGRLGGGASRTSACALGIMLAKFLLLIPVCLWLIDRWGRRPLLMLSSLLMAGGCAVAATSLAGHLPAVWAIAGISAHLVCYSLGMGPVMWAYCAEVLPTSTRGPGMGMAVLLSRALASGQLFLLPVVMDIWPWAPHLFFTITNLATVAFVFHCCPETKHTTLESLSDLFKK